MKQHYRKLALTKEEEDALYKAALNTPQERNLQKMLPKAGETFQAYTERVNFLLAAEFGPDRIPDSGGSMLRRDRNWLGTGEYGEIEGYALRQQARSLTSKSRKEVVDWMEQLVREFIRAAENGDEENLGHLIDQGVPVNFKDPLTGATALHYIAAYNARPAFRVLIKSKDLDYLVRDKRGRLASELAFAGGDDPAMGRLLRMKESKQAAAIGVRATLRPNSRV
jgi:hypothetical protein